MGDKAPMPPWWVERVDRDDGYINYEIWGGTGKTLSWIFTIYGADCSNAKELADLIVQRTKQ